jgi:hypothetical protein
VPLSRINFAATLSLISRCRESPWAAVCASTGIAQAKTTYIVTSQRELWSGLLCEDRRREGAQSKLHLEQSMQEEQIREALNRHWNASAAGDANAEHDIYDDDAICDYPQSGERILGRSNLQALRSHHPGKPSGFNVKRILGKGDLWITEYTITYQGRPAYTVSIMEFRNGKVVHETQYFADPFEAPAWRSQWVQRIA